MSTWARKTQPPPLLHNLATHCVYRAVAWQRVDQIHYNTIIANFQISSERFKDSFNHKSDLFLMFWDHFFDNNLLMNFV
jgi:hypothetical protein